jgi:hypothetical protein
MRRGPIPDDVKGQAEAAISAFNQQVIRDPGRYYLARSRGQYLYLDRLAGGAPRRIARLAYDAAAGAWEFAIFKYSDGRYDADEWLFPGSDFLDGTLEGALKAGLEAYP